MATATLRIEVGLTPLVGATAELFPAGTVAGGTTGIALTETAKGGTYDGTITNAAGTYDVTVKTSGGSLIYVNGTVTVDGTTGVQVSRERVDAAKLNGAAPNNLAAGAQMDLVNAPNATAITAIQSGIATAANLAALALKFVGMSNLANWLGLLGGKQVGNTTARTELNATGAGSGTFDETTDSGQAIRDALAANADPLENAVPGSYSAGTAGYALGRIGSQTITVVAPVASDGTITITRGDDYTPLAVTITGYTGEAVTGNTAVFSFGKKNTRGRTVEYTTTAVTITVATGTLTAAITIDGAGTDDLNADCYLYDIQVTLTNGDVTTPAIGDLNLTQDVTE